MNQYQISKQTKIRIPRLRVARGSLKNENTQPLQDSMTNILESIRAAWVSWTAIAAIAAATVAFAGIPGRVAALEKANSEVASLLRFMVCERGAERRNVDPAACESHLEGSLINYLRPPGR